MGEWNLPAERTSADSSIVADMNAIRDIIILLGGNDVSQPSSDIEALKALVDAAPEVPIGGEIQWGSETLPGTGQWQWKEGGSLLRASYTALRDLYIVSRGAVTMTLGADSVFTLNAHGFGTASCVSFTTTGALYTGLAINTNYYVIYVNANTFKLATTADLARAGTAITTSGSESGVHTLYSNPHGINGANSFYLPDGDGLVMRQTGDLTINGRTKTGVGLGVAEEDHGQGHYHGGLGANSIVQNGAVFGAAVGASLALVATTRGPSDDGTSGVSRIGITTQTNDIGVRYIVRVI